MKWRKGESILSRNAGHPTELTGSLSLSCQEQYPCILIAYAPKMSFTLPGLGGKTPRLLLAHTLSFT